MKNIFFLLLFTLFTINLTAQKKISFECFDCEKLDKDDCDYCNSKSATNHYLSGMMVRYDNGPDMMLRKPFQDIWTKGRTVYIKDMIGKEVSINVSKTVYNSTAALVDAIKECGCDKVNDPDIFIDNGDGTITHTTTDGDVVTWGVELVDNGDGTCSLVDVNGVNLGTCGGSWTTVVYNSITNSFEFTYPDGTIVNIVLPSDVLIDNGDYTYTHTTVDGDVVIIKTTEVVVNGDGTATITDGEGNPAIVCLAPCGGAEITITEVTNVDGDTEVTIDNGTDSATFCKNTTVVEATAADGGITDDGTTVSACRILLDRDMAIQPNTTEGEIANSITTSFADAVQDGFQLTDISTYDNNVAIAAINATSNGQEWITSGNDNENISGRYGFTTGRFNVNDASWNNVMYGQRGYNNGTNNGFGGTDNSVTGTGLVSNMYTNGERNTSTRGRSSSLLGADNTLGHIYSDVVGNLNLLDGVGFNNDVSGTAITVTNSSYNKVSGQTIQLKSGASVQGGSNQVTGIFHDLTELAFSQVAGATITSTGDPLVSQGNTWGGSNHILHNVGRSYVQGQANEVPQGMTGGTLLGNRGLVNKANAFYPFQYGPDNTVLHDYVVQFSGLPVGLTSTAQSQYWAHFTNGYTLYSNFAQTTGAFLAGGSSTWATTSDRTLKDDIKPMDKYGLDEIMQLEPVTFVYKTNSKEELESYKSQLVLKQSEYESLKSEYESFSKTEPDLKSLDYSKNAEYIVLLENEKSAINNKQKEFEVLKNREIEIRKNAKNFEEFRNELFKITELKNVWHSEYLEIKKSKLSKIDAWVVEYENKYRQSEKALFDWGEKRFELYSNYEAVKNKVQGLELTIEQIESDKQAEQLGLIAQDVQKAIPEAVVTGADGKLGIEYDKLIPILIKAIQEIEKR